MGKHKVLTGRSRQGGSGEVGGPHSSIPTRGRSEICLFTLSVLLGVQLRGHS